MRTSDLAAARRILEDAAVRNQLPAVSIALLIRVTQAHVVAVLGQSGLDPRMAASSFSPDFRPAYLKHGGTVPQSEEWPDKPFIPHSRFWDGTSRVPVNQLARRGMRSR